MQQMRRTGQGERLGVWQPRQERLLSLLECWRAVAPDPRTVYARVIWSSCARSECIIAVSPSAPEDLSGPLEDRLDDDDAVFRQVSTDVADRRPDPWPERDVCPERWGWRRTTSGCGRCALAEPRE